MKRKIDLLKAINTFIKVADKKSFTAAARELNIVTSAISRQVADLESHFDCQLLYRTTRAMHLTAEGDQYYKTFKEITDKITMLENKDETLDGTLKGHIKISAPQGSESLGYLDAASEFMKSNPKVTVSWLFVNRYVNMVEEGIDLSIRMGELEDSSYIARRYKSVEINFVVSPDYMEKYGKPDNPNDLTEHLCITDTSNRQPNKWRYCNNNQEKYVKINPYIESNNGETVARLAANGNGIAYLPSFLTQKYLQTGELVTVMQNYEFDSLDASLVYPANLMMNKTLKSFVQFIIKNK